MKLTYCSWEGDPAILAEYQDGRILAFHAPDEKTWKQVHAADVSTKSAVIDEASFKKRWPSLKLPTFPK